MIKFLTEKYEIFGLPGLKTTLKKRHYLIDMVLDLNTTGKVKIDMRAYKNKLIEKMTGYVKKNLESRRILVI